MKSSKKRSKRRSAPKQLKPVSPAWEFNVFTAPRTSPHYFRVFIHRTRRHMLAWRNKDRSKCMAFFSPAKWDMVIRFGPDGSEEIEFGNPYMGTLHFHPKSLTAGVIAHECFHAAISWAARQGCVPFCGDKEHGKGRDHDNEELCAELCGHLVAQIVTKISKLPISAWRYYLKDEAIKYYRE